jgi:hypothetical protein
VVSSSAVKIRQRYEDCYWWQLHCSNYSTFRSFVTISSFSTSSLTELGPRNSREIVFESASDAEWSKTRAVRKFEETSIWIVHSFSSSPIHIIIPWIDTLLQNSLVMVPMVQYWRPLTDRLEKWWVLTFWAFIGKQLGYFWVQLKSSFNQVSPAKFQSNAPLDYIMVCDEGLVYWRSGKLRSRLHVFFAWRFLEYLPLMIAAGFLEKVVGMLSMSRCYDFLYSAISKRIWNDFAYYLRFHFEFHVQNEQIPSLHL